MGNSPSLIQTRKQRKERKFFEDFFQCIHHEYYLSHQVDASSVDTRRTVFISLCGLQQTWKQCPPISLYNAIFILPLKKKWIQSPHKYQHQFSDLLQDEQLLTLLRWKSHQNLALFLMDDYSSSSACVDTQEESNLTAPVWKVLSSQLQQLSDPSRPGNAKYNALRLSGTYWQRHSTVSNTAVDPKRSTSFDLCARDVLLELYTVSMKFASIRQIVLESNPTLNVVTHYSNQPKHAVCSEPVSPSVQSSSPTYSSNASDRKSVV